MKIHQTLHGYAGGHRLIAASVELDPESRKDMAVLSDLSGTVMVPGFDSYLTGYPLRDADLYVLARTWYADEMDRPGSVWTHSLLLRFADLARLDDPAALLDFFRRPSEGGWDAGIYEMPIAAAPDARIPLQGSPSRVAESAPEQDAPLIEGLLHGLYGTAQPVFVVTDQPDSIEHLALHIWAQQWPRLRRSFSFCTGALDVRSLRRRPLDLQFVPRRRPRLEGVVLTRSSSTPGAAFLKDDLWLQLARTDLSRPGLTPLRQFLRLYGADIHNDRAAFRPLLEIFALIGQQQVELHELVTAIGRSFPDPTDAAKLKGTVLTIKGGAEGLKADTRVVAELITNPYATAFADAQARISTRVDGLLAADPDAITEVLAAIAPAQLNEIGNRLTGGVLAELGVENITQLVAREPAWLPEVLSMRPEIVSEPSFWGLPENVRADALSRLAEVWGRESDRWPPVVHAIALREPDLLEYALGYIGPVGVYALLDAIESGIISGETERWTESLAPRQETICSWISAHSGVLGARVRKTLVMVLDPLSSEVRALGSGPWKSIAVDAAALHKDASGHRELAFALAVAVGSRDSAAAELVSAVFPPLYLLAAENRLEGTAEALLRRIVPLRGSPPEWDRCEWLRRVLVDSAVDHGWNAVLVTRALPNPSDRERAARYAESFPQGRVLGRALMDTLPKPEPSKKPPPKRPTKPKNSRRRGWGL